MKTTTKPEVLKVSDYALIHDIPTYALNYLACGEDESLAPDDIENIEEWEKTTILPTSLKASRLPFILPLRLSVHPAPV